MKAKDTVFTIKIEKDLRQAFMAAAASEDRPASSIMRDLMRSYIAQQTNSSEYRAFLHKTIEVSRNQVRQGLGITDQDIEAEFSNLRKLS